MSQPPATYVNGTSHVVSIDTSVNFPQGGFYISVLPTMTIFATNVTVNYTTCAGFFASSILAVLNDTTIPIADKMHTVCDGTAYAMNATYLDGTADARLVFPSTVLWIKPMDSNVTYTFPYVPTYIPFSANPQTNGTMVFAIIVRETTTPLTITYQNVDNVDWVSADPFQSPPPPAPPQPPPAPPLSSSRPVCHVAALLLMALAILCCGLEVLVRV